MSTLSEKIQALLTYANGISGKEDATLGDAVKTLGDGFGGGENWMDKAVEMGIPLANIQSAYADFPDIKYIFMASYKKPYIKGDGFAYINSGVVHNSDVGFAMYFKEPNATTIDSILIGCRKDSGNTRWWVNGRKMLSICLETMSSTQYNSIGNPIVIKLNYLNNNLIVCNDFLYTNSAYFGSLDTIIYIFSANNYGSPLAISSHYISYVFLSQGDILSKAFVPFKKNNEYGMLDLMSMEFYGNANTNGEFSYVLE